MVVSVYPSVLKGKVDLPCSKSLLHRYLIAEFLSGRNTFFDNMCDDVLATFNALDSLKNGEIIDAENSASTLRFLLPVSLALKDSVAFRLGKSLKKRPFNFVADTFKSVGIDIVKNDDIITASGRLKPGKIITDASISSQLVSGLLFALPVLDGDSELIIDSTAVSADYISMTLSVLEKYSVKIVREGNTFYIKGNQQYIPSELNIEKDYSSYAVYAVLNRFGSEIECPGLMAESVQGDSVIDRYLLSDCDTFDMKDCIDLCPVFSVYLASMNKDSRMTGVINLKHKESNRAEEIVKLLNAFSVKAEFTDESGGTILIHGSGLKSLESYTSDDHRMVMAAIIGALTVGGEVGGAECVTKSYPSFLEDIIKLGAKIDVR